MSTGIWYKTKIKLYWCCREFWNIFTCRQLKLNVEILQISTNLSKSIGTMPLVDHRSFNFHFCAAPQFHFCKYVTKRKLLCNKITFLKKRTIVLQANHPKRFSEIDFSSGYALVRKQWRMKFRSQKYLIRFKSS